MGRLLWVPVAAAAAVLSRPSSLLPSGSGFCSAVQQPSYPESSGLKHFEGKSGPAFVTSQEAAYGLPLQWDPQEEERPDSLGEGLTQQSAEGFTAMAEARGSLNDSAGVEEESSFGALADAPAGANSRHSAPTTPAEQLAQTSKPSLPAFRGIKTALVGVFFILVTIGILLLHRPQQAKLPEHFERAKMQLSKTMVAIDDYFNAKTWMRTFDLGSMALLVVGPMLLIEGLGNLGLSAWRRSQARKLKPVSLVPPFRGLFFLAVALLALVAPLAHHFFKSSLDAETKENLAALVSMSWVTMTLSFVFFALSLGQKAVRHFFDKRRTTPAVEEILKELPSPAAPLRQQ